MHLLNSALISPPSAAVRPAIADEIRSTWPGMTGSQRRRLLLRFAAVVARAIDLPAGEVGEALGRRSGQTVSALARSFEAAPAIGPRAVARPSPLAAR